MEIEREDEINLLDYWRVIKKRWKIIACFFGASVVAAAIVSLLMTPIYQAKTTIMPVESAGGSFSSALQNLGNLPFVGSMIPGIGGASADKLTAILESRTVAENIIEDIELIKVFFEYKEDDELPTLQDAVESLGDVTNVTDDKKGLIIISVEYKDPHIAADIANHYTVELQKFLNENSLSVAKRNRIFIENQLKKVKGELKEAEEAMKSFQIDKRIVAMDVQAEAAIKAVSDLKAQVMAKEVQLGVIKQFSTSANPDVLRIKDELRELKKQLITVESKGSNPEAETLPSLSDAPALGLQYIRLRRNTLIHEKVFELLTQQYEIAKIEEAREEITFQVIDPAIPPEKRIKPKRALIVLLAGFVSLFLGVFLVFSLEYLANLEEPMEQVEEEI